MLKANVSATFGIFIKYIFREFVAASKYFQNFCLRVEKECPSMFWLSTGENEEEESKT